MRTAEESCLSDSEVRTRRREREAEKRQVLDRAYVERFARGVRDLFPYSPPKREIVIAEHACQKYSGRVGRSAAAKDLREDTIRLAVIAHIRHRETPYDELLLRGHDRSDARAEVELQVEDILYQWQTDESLS
ncbi:DUF2293 domain-containing protein [Planctomycetota bacterium]